MLFKYGCRDKIEHTFLLFNTFKQMSIARRTNSKVVGEWEKISAFMEDSVAKNMLIKEHIANTLMSDHISLHLLCVSHIFVVFDKDNVCVVFSSLTFLC